MKKIRAVLSGIVALAAIGTFSVFAFRSDSGVSNVTYNEIAVADVSDEFSGEDSFPLIRETPERPDDEEIFAVGSAVTARNDYEAVQTVRDYLEVIPLNEKLPLAEPDPDPEVTVVPPEEPDAYLPETVAPLDDSVRPPVEIAEEVTSVKEAAEKEDLVFEDITQDIDAVQTEEHTTTTVFRPNDLMLYSGEEGGYYEAQYVEYNFDTPSILPLDAPEDEMAAQIASLPQIDEFGNIIEGDDIPAPAPAPKRLRTGYLIPGPYNGSEVFTVNFGGERQEVDAYTIVCMICATEMSPSFSYEALKAQAVAAYSYVKYHNVNGLVPSVVVKYSVSETTKAAIDEVFGQCVYYDGRVAQTVYTASTAGTTASAVNVWGGGGPYLSSIETPIDSMYDPNWGVVTQFTKDEMKGYIERYCGIALSENPEQWITINSYHDGKYVREIYIDNQVSVTGMQFREGLMHYQLKSWAFDVYYDPIAEVFTFTTYGYGHGVGLSQNGANILGRQGYTYDQILAYYFPGTYIQ